MTSLLPRIFILVIIGVLMAMMYIGGWSDELIATPFTVGLLIGFFSQEARAAYLHSAIALLSALVVLVGQSLAVATPPARVPALAHYVGSVGLVLSHYALLFVTWIPGVAVGVVIRHYLRPNKTARMP